MKIIKLILEITLEPIGSVIQFSRKKKTYALMIPGYGTHEIISTREKTFVRNARNLN